MIELKKVTKKFGDLIAVNDVSLMVPSGQFYALLGPNAAGKTTTIKLICGLIKADAGAVAVAGFDLQNDPLSARKRLAYVPDFPFLYEKLTPWEFFLFIGRLFAMNPEKTRSEANELIQRFHLEEFLRKRIEGLSHGTRQRVALASALLHLPEVMVIDEPMVGLDPQHARIVKDILKERSVGGMTVFMSTHQLSVAEELADRIGIMHQGRVIAEGTSEQLRQQAGVNGALEASFLALTHERPGVSESKTS